jgi:hypothetical protein
MRIFHASDSFPPAFGASEDHRNLFKSLVEDRFTWDRGVNQTIEIYLTIREGK